MLQFQTLWKVYNSLVALAFLRVEMSVYGGKGRRW